VSVAHPLRMRAGMLAGPAHHGWRHGYTLGFQLPVLPESRLVRDDAEQVGQMLHAWSGPGWPDKETEHRYRAAMGAPSVAHSALEYHRWFLRSALRPDGLRYAHRMRAPIQAPTLHLHGALDPCVLARSAQGSARYVAAPYRWRLIDGAGHFLPEEQPDRFDSALRTWLADPEPER
jgi:pimeloyl-ACP methyl ester carboxylesterase